MAFKTALVVDDSRSARVAMKVMLEEHGLVVEFAESGEEGLEFLKKNLVDVIFMDHTMPGMDGLEAVAQIKANPRTATIPVMMYTTKEGEVYVSQARALGAVGVLPKEVHPGVLFNMLLELGLVADRRAEPREPAAIAAPSTATDTGASVQAEITQADTSADPELDKQALGMSLQAVVTRILEDQHLSLRSDILFSHREFARQVADEIFTKQQHQQPAAEPVAPATSATGYSQRTVTLLALLLLVPAMVFGMLYVETRGELERAQAQLRELDTQVSEQLSAAERVTTDLIKDMNDERASTQTKHLATLQWALNQGGQVPFAERPFNGARAETLERLLTHLRELRFEGTVRLTSHLGEFCLTANAAGEILPAEPNAGLGECALMGHPLDASTFASDRLTPEFADFLDSSPLANGSGIRVALTANDRTTSVRKFAYPISATTAGEWNQVAARNHRIEVELLPD